MTTFQEKLKTVEARQFAGDQDELMAVVEWVIDNGYTWYELFSPAPARGVTIQTTTGFLALVNSQGLLATAQKGDWVIKRVDGDFQVMKDPEFQATYEQIAFPDPEDKPTENELVNQE